VKRPTGSEWRYNTLHVQDGFLVEKAFFGYVSREYPELEIQKAADHLDHKYGVDFFVTTYNEEYGRKFRTPFALTTKMCEEKWARDASKSATKFPKHVQVVIHPDSGEDSIQAFDNACDWLLNDCTSVLSNKSTVVLVCYPDRVEVRPVDRHLYQEQRWAHG
jgi:hypothetical protein